MDVYQLKKMSESSKFVDMTERIRDVKHSAQLKKSIYHLMEFKKQHATLFTTNRSLFEEKLMLEDNFLFFNYMELYTTLLKTEVEPDMMNAVLTCLEQIETGECDQHEASVRVGTLLKSVYIDKVIQDTTHEATPLAPQQSISWKEYRDLHYA
jgi:hypothetical protein